MSTTDGLFFNLHFLFKQPFVVLDLETSGVDPKRDDIIEVAMIRYEEGKEVARYDALISVDYKLPKIITVITGITDKDLKENGQDKGLVFEEIEAMLEGAYLIAHNTGFDHGFLKEKGLKLDLLGVIDTIPLAQILYPTAASYSLESLSDDFNIKHVNKHRAMGDVEATLELFRILCKRADDLPLGVLEEIRTYLAQSDWDAGAIFEGAKGSTAVKASIPTEEEIVAPLSDATPAKALSVEDVLNEGGALQRYWPDYEPRAQQQTMSSNVMNAFDQGYHLVCEAPTGVGKSLAYLIPSVYKALTNKSKVVISTNTINLQEQLYEKDIPLLQDIYKEATQNSGFRAALLKGRSHYLCLRRLAKFKEKGRFSPEEMVLLIKVLVWQATSITGDSGEIHLSRNEHLIWNFELCSEKNYCSPNKCKAYGECYLHKARKQAQQADVVIVNHALLCADLQSEGGLLPDYQYLVVDEAHHFEDAATNAFGLELKQENFSLPLRVIGQFFSILQKKYQGTLFGPQSAMEQLPALQESVSELQDKLENLFTIIAYFVGRNVKESSYVENLLVDPVILGMEEWLNLVSSVEEVAQQVRRFLKGTKDFVETFMLSGEESEQSEYFSEILQESDLLYEQLSALTHFFADEEVTENIRWMSSGFNGQVGLHLAPMLAGNQLTEALYDKKKSIILTSATLGVKLQQEGFNEEEQHPFSYFRRMLNLDERFEELVIDSPFDYEKQAYVLLPDNIKSVVNPKSNEELTPFFEMLIKAVGGNMMSLFTSYRMIEILYLNLMQPLQNQGVRLLAQRISGGRNKIMKAYRQDPDHSILFGTSSFWEGVDIKGDALTTLVIHKLPFDMPNDPIFKARSQLFANGFMEYSVPRAILKFRQGFGRLIRSTKDYGVMVVLDNRVLTKEYGKLFLKALPDNITMEESNLMEIPDKVKTWLGLSAQD